MAFRSIVLPSSQLRIVRYFHSVRDDDFDRQWAESRLGCTIHFDDLCLMAPGTDVSGIAFETAKTEAKRVAESHANLPPGVRKRGALIYPDQIVAVSVRMFIAYFRALEVESFEVEVFDTAEQGLNWIEAGRPANRPGSRFDRREIDAAIAELAEIAEFEGLRKQA